MRVLAALVLVSCAGSEDGLPAEVPASWKEHRLASGHVVHLEKDVRCKDCHRSSYDRPSLLVCDNCHESVRDRSHHSADAPKNDCYSCHPFKEKTEVKENACKRCHEPKTHETTECLECHAPHRDPPLAISGCVKCHEEGSNVHRGMTEIDGCSACHTGHAEKSAAPKTCDSCHEVQAEKRKKGHQDCATCHVPHGKERTCASCHEEKDQHTSCSNCHAIHGERSAAATCGDCHNDVQVEHTGGATDCVSCHPPHQPIAACSRCHDDASNLRKIDRANRSHGDRGPRVDAKLVSEVSKSFQANQSQAKLRDRALHAGDLACSACHRPHSFNAESTATCESCHAKQEQARADGHSDCRACHEKAEHFAKRPPKSCASCHEMEKQTAPKGHDDCAICHEPHSGQVSSTKTCSSCHELAPDPHTKSGDCRTCHAPHGPKARPASCSSCHQQKSGLHQDAGHADCKGCHQPHQPAIDRGRASCDRCHQLPNHEPNVKTCLGCHPFRDFTPEGRGGGAVPTRRMDP